MTRGRRIAIKRIYEPAQKEDGARILVDRVWPRGLSKDAAAVDHWARDLAPSTALRKWFGHDPAKWDEFQRRYREELEDRASELNELIDAHGDGPMTLLFGAKDVEHNQAVVLKDVLLRWRKGESVNCSEGVDV